MKINDLKSIFIFFLLALVSGLHAQEVGFGYSVPLILDNRISEALPVFAESETLALDTRISEALPVFGVSGSFAYDASISEALPFYAFTDVFAVFTVLTIHIDNTAISPPTDTCMQALQTIILSDVLVESNASITMAAGENILIQTLAQVESGAYLRAYIDNTWLVCQQMEGMLAASVFQDDAVIEWPELRNLELFFSVYPNPASGQFTLELNDVAESSTIKVEIFNMFGERVMNMELPAMKQYLFDLSAKQTGLYLIRVMKGDRVGMTKILLQ